MNLNVRKLNKYNKINLVLKLKIKAKKLIIRKINIKKKFYRIY